MLYTTLTAITSKYTIKPVNAAMNVQTQYHLEVTNISTGIKRMYAASALTAAVAPTTDNSGTSGLVTFNSVSLPNEGLFIINVFYSDTADLDVATSVTQLGSGVINRITSVDQLTIA